MAGVWDSLEEIFDHVDDLDRGVGGLSGVTLEEIRVLAGRLRVGEEFASFEEFDLAVDSWGFINGRPCRRVKTQKDFCLRVCREGSRMVTRKETIDFAERVPSIQSGSRDQETFTPFESFTQGHHVRTGPYDRQNIRMARNGRCGERQRYITAGNITRRGMRGMSSTPIIRQSEPPFAPSQCDWRVKARSTSYDNGGGVVVTVCKLEHTCSNAVSRWRGPTSNSKFLVRIMGAKMGVDLNARIRNLQEDMRISYGEVTEYHQMWRARELSRELMHCSNADSFHLIPELLEKMREADSGCIIDWGKFEGTDIFSRAFVSPSACRNMLQYCQKVIAVDACHSKNRKFPCQIFLASALDGNKEALILCFAVAHTEDIDTWTWFCNFMKESIPGIDKDTTVIISDRQKGLASAVDEVFEDVVHGSCAHHILMNLQSRFGKTLASNFNSILYAKTPERCTWHCLLQAQQQLVLLTVSRPLNCPSLISSSPSTCTTISSHHGLKGHCGCAEYQEMQWPCSHGLAFERELGTVFEDRFDPVWWVESLQNLYGQNYIPLLDLGDLCPDTSCRAPPEAVRRGRHRVVRIPNNFSRLRSESGPSSEAPSTAVHFVEYEFDMADEPLVLVPNDQTVGEEGRSMPEHGAEEASASRPRIRRRNSASTVRCSNCKQLGHNRRTCTDQISTPETAATQ